MLKFPSISKQVRWRVVVPTLSMSGVRKHFWQLVSRWCGGFSRPWKYGFSGGMPAGVSSTDGSCSAGTSDADGSRLWSRLSKKLRKRSRISSEVIAPESRLRAMRVVSSRVVYENRWMRVHEDRTEWADGAAGLYGWVEK